MAQASKACSSVISQSNRMNKVSPSELHRKLREHGLSPSAPRVAIYEWLLTHPVHPTIDTIYKALRPKMASLSRTTVYNVLHALVEVGLAEKVHSEDLELRYDGNIAPHAHFKCRLCGAVTDLGAIPSTVATEVGLPQGFQAESASVTLWGHCPACAVRQTESA